MGLILALVLSACAVQTQEESRRDPALESTSSAPTLTAGAVGRSVFPVTSLARDFGLVPPGAPFPNGDLRGTFGWSDFFQVGVGGSLEFNLLWEDPAIPNAWVVGAYATIGFDSFLGRKATDANGASIDPENLEVFSLMVGPKLVKQFESGCFIDGRLGMGVVNYSSVDADVHIAPTFGPAQDYHGEFLASTATFGMELGIRVGLRTGSASFVLGAVGRILAGAERGDTVSMSPNTLVAVGIDLGVELRF